MDKRIEQIEQFRTALRSGQLTQAFVTALSQGVELTVTTWVNAQDHPQTTPSPAVKSRFHFNLLANKIETEIGEQFLNHPHASTLQQFQQQQIAEANATLQANLHCLEQLHRAFARFEQFSAATPFSALPPSASEPLEPEDNVIDDLLDSFGDEPEEEWDEEPETETCTPQVLTIEDFEVTEEDWDEEEEELPPSERASDWQLESAEVDVMPTFEVQEQVNWRPPENQNHEPDPGTEADWDELDHTLDLDSPEENP
jgi:hypothetical protein